MSKPGMMGSQRHRGAALLTAMLTLVLVSTLAAGAAWQQWRGVEVERAERLRLQSSWILVGALDWARLILREDARSGGPDHLGEPWAVALEESRLSSFLAADKDNSALLSEQDDGNIFLSGQMDDLQGRLNVSNLMDAGRVNPMALAAFAKLFDLQGLEQQELRNMAENLRFSSDWSTNNLSGAKASFPVQRVDQLSLLGLSPQSLERLRPFITWLPSRTPVNLNTASAEVIYAVVPDLDLDGARKIVAERSRQHFKTISDVSQVVPAIAAQLAPEQHSITTSFFEVTGKLRIADGPSSIVVFERSTVKREGLEVKTLWREKGTFTLRPGEKSFDQLNTSRR